jgi:hypothetical protein
VIDRGYLGTKGTEEAAGNDRRKMEMLFTAASSVPFSRTVAPATCIRRRKRGQEVLGASDRVYINLREWTTPFPIRLCAFAAAPLSTRATIIVAVAAQQPTLRAARRHPPPRSDRGLARIPGSFCCCFSPCSGHLESLCCGGVDGSRSSGKTSSRFSFSA